MKFKSAYGFWCAIILTGVVAAAYWPLAQADFVLIDDPMYVTHNPAMLHGLTGRFMLWSLTAFSCGNWHPLTWMSHALDISFFGFDPLGHHATNVLLHIACAWVLWRFLFRALENCSLAIMLAVVFAIHPLNVESVAWVAERKNLLSTLFGLLCLCAYLKYVARPNAWRYLLVTLLFVLSLCSKAMLVTMPCVMLLLDHWPLKRTCLLSSVKESNATIPQYSLRKLALEKLPLLVICIGASIVTIHAQNSDNAIKSFERAGIWLRLCNVTISYVNYLGKFFYPVELALYYPLPQSYAPAQIVLSALCLIVVTALVTRQARSRPFLLVGWLWFLGTLVPVIGLVQLGGQAMADRYMYVPMIGLLIAAGSLLAELIQKFKPKRASLMIAGIGLAIVLILATSVQAIYWRNTFSLYAHTLAVTQNNSLMECEFAQQLQDMGQPEQAIEHYKAALEISPGYDKAVVGMSGSLLSLGKPKEAQALLERALKTAQNQASVLEALGQVFLQNSQYSEAAHVYAKVVELQPQSVEAWCSYSLALQQIGQTDQANHAIDQAITLGPRYTGALTLLSQQLRALSRPREALPYARRAYEYEPRSLAVLLEYASAMGSCGQLEQAIDKLNHYIQAQPTNAEAYVLLGQFEQKLGKNDKAIEHLKTALKLKPDHKTAQAMLQSLDVNH